MYYCSTLPCAVPMRFREAEKHTLCILFAYTKTHTHILSHCPFSHATLSIYLTAQKNASHNFARRYSEKCYLIIYFSPSVSTFFFSLKNALFASFAALFARRLTFRYSMYFFGSTSTRLPSLSYATKSTESSV